jgi:transcription antitermination factor NusG
VAKFDATIGWFVHLKAVKNTAKQAWESMSGAMGRTAANVHGHEPVARRHVQTEAVSWFAIETRYRFEKKSVAALHEKGVETFVPMRREMRRWSDRNKAIQVPLFPGYAFVHIDGSRMTRLCVLQTEGVLGFVGPQHEPATIPDTQIRDLQSLLAEKLSCSLHPFLKVGQRIRIRGGSLDGLQGILSENNKKSLIVSIDAIERSVAVEIAGYEVELI